MALFKVYILEDEDVHARHLISLLNSYQSKHPGIRFDVTRFDDSLRFLEQYHGHADLIFLDIQMPGPTGMEVAQKLRENDPDVMLIFTTALTQYAIDGYHVGAFDYFVKPLNEAVFLMKMERICRIMSQRRQSVTLNVKTKEGSLWRLLSDDVLYISSDMHDIVFRTVEATYRARGVLRNYEELLRDAGFSRCSSSALVNLRYVSGISNDEVIVGQEKLTIGGTKRKSFLSALVCYNGREQV